MDNIRSGSFVLNFWTLTTSKVLYRLVSIGVAMYLARMLGAGVLGQYATVMNVLTLYLAFADLGVTNLVIRDVSRDKTLSGGYLDTFFALQLIVGVILLVLIMVTGWASRYAPVMLLALAVGSAGPLLSGLANTWQALMNASELFYPFAVIEMVCLVVFALGSGAVVLAGQGLVALVAVTTAVAAVKFILGGLWSWRLNMRVRIPGPAAIFNGLRTGGAIRGMLRAGLPFLLINGSHFALQRLDVLYLSWMLPDERVGVYAAASRLVYASLFLLAAVGTMLYPMFSRLLLEDAALARERYRRGSSWLFVGGCMMAAVFYLAAPHVINLLYGKGFEEGIMVLRLLGLFLPLFAGGLLASNVLMVSSHVWQAVRATGIAFAALLVLSPVLIQQWGINGAGLSVLAAECIAMVLYLVYAHRSLACVIDLGRWIRAAGATALIMLLAALYPPATDLGVLPGTLVIYGLLLYFGRVLTAGDLRDLRGLLLAGRAA